MTAKETKIKEAYESAGVDWEQVKEFIDVGGYCYVFYDEEGKKGIDWHTETPLTYSGIDAYDENDVEYWRPISLSGIETNNGWITIESEKDLPPDGHYWTINKKGEINASPKLVDETCNDNQYWLSTFTHYQPIAKPKPPIY